MIPWLQVRALLGPPGKSKPVALRLAQPVFYAAVAGSPGAHLDLETEALRTISTWGHRRSISAKNSSLSLTAIISSS